MKEKLKRVSDYEWLLEKSARGGMNVAAKLIASSKIKEAMEDEAVYQLTNVACLPGVVEPVIGLPDAHVGF